MLVFKCKMCGGSLEIHNNETVGICEYCGTKQTLPKLSDYKKVNLYDRANHFRRNNDFDKAMSIYEQILNEDKTDSEAYWSLVLCRYGIEYVEDPATHKRIPTVNRAQYTSIFADEDYKAALEYADSVQKEVYEAEARSIDEIQKGILEISNKEEPFDVFICYKETDNNGRRTHDSVLANDLYHQLTQEGFKVFFSRITLEDKLGSAYEPYIFAALNSAKVMVVIGTKAEYYNAVWVKNEWSRYLALIKNGAKKTLIPAYRDMDPYDLPDEFSHLQAQDMSKLGFMQDLIRGIKKITETSESKTTVKETVVVNNSGNSNTESLIKRMFMFLEDGDFDSANEYAERVLDQNPENATAYLGKLMSELKASKKEDLKNSEKSFDNNSNYKKIVRFGDDKLVVELKGYIDFINKRNDEIRKRNEKAEYDRKNGIYNKAVELMNKAKSADDFNKAGSVFAEIDDFKDAHILFEKCVKFSKDCITYDLAMRDKNYDTLLGYKNAIKKLETILDYKDAKGQIEFCKKQVEIFELKSRKNKKIAMILTPSFIICTIIIYCAYSFVILPNINKDVVVVAVGYNESEQCEVSDWEDISEISVGYSYTVGLKSDGTVVAVGNNDDGQCDVADWEDIVSIACGGHHTVGMRSDGTVVAVGNNDDRQCTLYWHDIVAISAGYDYTVGLKSDGTVVAVGNNDDGQCNVDYWNDIVAISAGYDYTVGLKSDGTVVAVGDNVWGQRNVSDWNDIVAISAGDKHTVGLKSDGTVVAVGEDDDGQCNVSDWKDTIAISAGYDYTVGLKSDGTVVAVGNNDYGQCNVSDWRNRGAISAGYEHTVGLIKTEQ